MNNPVILISPALWLWRHMKAMFFPCLCTCFQLNAFIKDLSLITLSRLCKSMLMTIKKGGSQSDLVIIFTAELVHLPELSTSSVMIITSHNVILTWNFQNMLNKIDVSFLFGVAGGQLYLHLRTQFVVITEPLVALFWLVHGMCTTNRLLHRPKTPGICSVSYISYVVII